MIEGRPRESLVLYDNAIEVSSKKQSMPQNLNFWRINLTKF
jgi:hypothetical protein